MIAHPRSPVARALAGLAALFVLAACTTPTPYGPSSEGGYGYREQRIESDRYIVTFSGNSATNPDGVVDAAMRRAADLTLEQGYEWFQVVSRNTDIDASSRGSGLSVGVGGVSGGGNTSVGTSVGMSFPLGGASGATTTSLEIRMGRGERPEDSSVYDAQSVARNLAAAPMTP